ncbi:SPW repeat domain-containing protein [Alienimonas californiensis]|uniref:SPW repeat-containing integral membrane domain-containing protein n=1 Tax=Alienimonas californiensis TaxID=2527989 RepID=A0A517P4V5_9PLAN|nr:hypothetical protein [Alienimonas californiensis]QDT14417.1 hypothetical protein CA12_04900 [Alienimonas californiensis]
MRFIPTRLHAIADYGTAVLLFALPWLLGLAATERGEGYGALVAVCVAAGAGLALLSLVTNYEGGLLPAVPMPAHLTADAIMGAVLIAAPWVFGFAETFGDWTWAAFVAIGLMEIGAALFTHTRSPAAVPTDPRPGTESHSGAQRPARI